MRKGTDSKDIRGSAGTGVNRAPANKKRQGGSVSLTTAMWNSLTSTNEALLFQHQIKGTNVSKIVELAIAELFKNETPEEIAKRIANDIRKLTR
ncbi:hypothetical protein [Vibrio sp. ABG19]|uniref:hypothetical protein n=1 Tax=Vibrio sp. ABG19 TaxID=2817385 RepID=UPI00249DBEAD|nr:hypothetical protein [Vibrio sp. ABG19]WGY45250.1 hypothetical protein J0X00_06035 [Vibrio sp. ABG19]